MAAVAAVTTTAGCSVNADYGGTSYACDESGACPGGQACVEGQCRASVDARSVDARELDPPDAGGPADANDPRGEGCRELYARGERASGIYAIRPSAPPRSPIDVYCDMDVAGGGWTVIGRSAPEGVGTFGWRVSRGTPGDADRAYGLDVRVLDGFTEVLVATRGTSGSGLGAGDIAYRLSVPPGFPDAFPTTSTDALAAITERGDCAPAGGPEALRYWGYTAEATHYSFDEQPDLAVAGLTPGGFLIESVGCIGGADLGDGDQGVLLIR